MKQKTVLFLLLLGSQLSADPILTFFFRNFPQVDLAQRTMDKLKKPHAIAKRTLLGLTSHNPIAGIFSTYYGFINVSDYIGQTSFPRKQSKGEIKLFITNKISPVMMFNNTVSHWELVAGAPAAAYTLELKEDPETKLSLWLVNQGTVPQNGQIPATESLIILAKPHNVYMPLGATLSSQDTNLELPDIYAKKGISSTRNALYMLNLTFLFRPVDLLYKKEKKRYGTLVAE